jgi:hypothetical protein
MLITVIFMTCHVAFPRGNFLVRTKITCTRGAGDLWHSLKIICADKKNTGIIYMTIFGQFDSGNKVKGPELV